MIKEKKNSNKCPICGRLTHKESKYCIFHASAEEKTEEEFKKALKMYVNKIKKEDGDYDFKDFIFIGGIDFKKDLNIIVFKNADFGEATFKEDVYFWKVTFHGEANFGETTFKKYAGLGGATFHGEAYFGKATFQGEANFGGVTFQGEADFGWVTFHEEANFKKAIFQGNSNFLYVTFQGVVDFRRATFKRDAFFVKTTFKGWADFEKTIFQGDTNFWWGTFQGVADFRGANFKRWADFSNITFHEEANFNKVIFKGNHTFWKPTFQGVADFRGAAFYREANFGGATFKEDANFWVKSFVKGVTFANVSVLPGKKLDLKVVNNKVNVSFKRAYLENAYLKLDLGEGTSIDFTDALLKNTKIEKEQIEKHILQEKKKEFSQTKEIYLLLKNNFHSIGRYEDESWAFKKEKDMERLSCSFYSFKKDLVKKKKREIFPILKWIYTKDFKKWIISAFSNMIYGYGERPWNVVKTALAIIIIFALSFSLIGIGNPEIIELKGTGIYQNSGNIIDLASKGLLKNNEIRNFPDCLYFSLITFTTLGYGDFRPLEGVGRILAGSEAFIGAFMMALFVYTFARRTGGR